MGAGLVQQKRSPRERGLLGGHLSSESVSGRHSLSGLESFLFKEELACVVRRSGDRFGDDFDVDVAGAAGDVYGAEG